MASRRRQGQRHLDARSTMTAVDAANAMYGEARVIPLEQITIDPAIQVRVDGLDMNRVEQYAELLLAGGEFKDPIVCFQDGDKLLLSAGFHRHAAYLLAQARWTNLPEDERVPLKPLKIERRDGGRLAALRHAEKDNLAHGLDLKPKDKKNILARRYEREDETIHLSDRILAAEFGVSHPTIAAWRREIIKSTGKNFPVDAPLRVGADGKVRDVSGIQAANEQRAQERARQKAAPPPSPRRVTRDGGYDFNQDSGYEEDALDYGGPETWDTPPASAPPARDSAVSPARRVSAALGALGSAITEVRAAVEAMDAEQDHLAVGEPRLLDAAITEVVEELQGYRSRDGQRVAGLIDLLDGLRRFVRGGRP